jgi:hypothetical protein
LARTLLSRALIDRSYHCFKRNRAFPIALTVIDFAITALGIWQQINATRLAGSWRGLLPADLRELVAVRQR